MRSILSLVLAAGLASSVLAAEVSTRTLDLKSGAVDTTIATNLLAQKAPFKAAQRYVIQFVGPMTPERAAALSAAGVKLGGYLPQYAYIATLQGVSAAALTRAGVVWVGEFQTAWKLDPELGRRMYKTPERRLMNAQGLAILTIETFAGEKPGEAQALVTRLGGTINSADTCGEHWLIEASLPYAMVDQVAALPSVQFIEDGVEIDYRNDSNRWILQSNVSPQTPIWDRGIHGEGQIAGHIDDTISSTHCMFTDVNPIGPTHRKLVAARSASSAGSHGTHTAGTLAGDNTPYGSYTTNDGMAYAAKISNTRLGAITSTNLITNLTAAHTDGARNHTNSWGDDSTRNYTAHCQQIDQFTYNNEDNMVAFAVSNGSLATTPENAINVLGVGATQDSPNQGNFCSGGTGPTLDGRRKPEIFAPGCGTVSASVSACGTASNTGTSMACPAVTGAGVLVRQYYTDGFYPTGAAVPANSIIPTGALIRATLLNSTVDMTGISGYPSNGEGFGRVLLDNTLFFPGDARKLQVVDVRNAGGLSTGGQTSYPINVASSTQPLKITMVFTAPPSTINAANPVINDLNLEVVGPGGTYLGNVFASGQSTTGGAADAKNNVEMVILTSPAAGAYTVTVKGAAVNQGTQGYAVVISGDLGSACTGASVSGQPAALSVEDTQPASFTITAAGTGPINYQWRRNTANLSNDARITGVNTATLNISSTVLADAGSYDCVVTNACGNATSNAAALTVSCYANCDSSSTAPILNALDFGCFLSAFAAGSTYANCDASTTAPTLNALDFGCFLSKFAAGCP